MNRVLALVAALATVAALRAATAAATPQLQYVVIVGRHGVRAPTWTPARLNQYSAEPWPDFGVPPGHLTPQGARLMRLMGGYFGRWLESERIIERRTCADARRLFVWADTDQRTRETGRELAAAIMPGCRIAVHALAGASTDPLFDPIDAGLVAPDVEGGRVAVRERLGAEPHLFMERHRDAFQVLDHILTGGAAAQERPFDAPASIEVASRGKAVEISGPLAAASTLSENLLLEYANGFRGSELGWGRLTARNLKQVLQLHTAYADLMRRTPALARARGSNLLAHVLRSLEQAAAGKAVPGALGHPGDAALIIAGHDTNLSNISGMLQLAWHIDGYPADDTPPGGALIFSLWRDAIGALTVRLRYVVQTPEQFRRTQPLTLAAPPAFEDLRLPGCDKATTGNGCPWSAFAQVVSSAYDPALVH